jgi:hypothetical protein
LCRRSGSPRFEPRRPNRPAAKRPARPSADATERSEVHPGAPIS